MEYQEQYVYPIFYRNIEIDDISDAEKTKGTQKEAALQKRKFHLFDMEKFLKKETAYFYFCPFCGNMDTLYHYQKENYPEMSEMLKEALKERLLKQEYSDFEKLPVEWKEILSLTLPVYYAKKKSINVDEFKCTCPRCGKTFSNYERRSLISSYSQRRGERNFRFEDGGNKRIFKYTIKTQENRIILNIIKKKYIIMETHLVFETSSTVYIFHTDTGLSYRMRERLVPSGKAVEKEYPRIMQFSSAFLKSNYFSNDFKNDEMIKTVLKQIIEKHGCREDDRIFENKIFLSGEGLSLINRFSKFNFEMLYFLIRLREVDEAYGEKVGSELKKRYSGVKMKMLEEVIRGEASYENFLKKAGIRRISKSIKRNLISNPILAYDVAAFESVGISDLNIMNDLILNILKSAPPSDIVCAEHTLKKYKDVVNELINRKGQRWIYKILMSAFYRHCNCIYENIFNDAFKMLNGLFKNPVNNKMINDAIKTTDIRELHDGLIDVQNEILERNAAIWYEQKEKNLECRLEGIDFKLPTNSKEIREAGRELHNCVAAYAVDAIAKECTLVLMKKEEKIIGCIELIENKKFMVMQAYGPCNEYFKGKPKEAFKKWAKENKIKNYETFLIYQKE